jgi:hypothetical protein
VLGTNCNYPLKIYLTEVNRKRLFEFVEREKMDSALSVDQTKTSTLSEYARLSCEPDPECVKLSCQPALMQSK